MLKYPYFIFTIFIFLFCKNSEVLAIECPDKSWQDKIENDNGILKADYNAIYNPITKKTTLEVLFWDATTGASRLFIYDETLKNYKEKNSNFQIPALPLGSFTGKIDRVAMDINTVYDKVQKEITYTLLVWDKKTGKSICYTFDTGMNQFQQTGAIPQTETQSIASNNGEIMMELSSVSISSSNKVFTEVLAWNNKTGNSKLFNYNSTNGQFQAHKQHIQLPKQTALLGSNGNIMIDYNAVHIPSINKTFYEALAWNTYTGKSILYIYDYENNKFVAHKSHIQLPQSPLSGNTQHNIMMKYQSVYIPSSDKTFYEALVWDKKTADVKHYFYDFEKKKFVKYQNTMQTQVKQAKNSGSNNINLSYIANNNPSTDKTHYGIVLWNELTGATDFYEYNYQTHKYQQAAKSLKLN